MGVKALHLKCDDIGHLGINEDLHNESALKKKPLQMNLCHKTNPTTKPVRKGGKLAIGAKNSMWHQS